MTGNYMDIIKKDLLETISANEASKIIENLKSLQALRPDFPDLHFSGVFHNQVPLPRRYKDLSLLIKSIETRSIVSNLELSNELIGKIRNLFHNKFDDHERTLLSRRDGEISCCGMMISPYVAPQKDLQDSSKFTELQDLFTDIFKQNHLAYSVTVLTPNDSLYNPGNAVSIVFLEKPVSRATSFAHYMYRYVDEDSIKGDLATDIYRDNNYLWVNEPEDLNVAYRKYLSYLESQCACNECISAFKRQWRNYLKYKNAHMELIEPDATDLGRNQII